MPMQKWKRLRITLRAYDSMILVNSCDSILHALQESGLKVIGPVPLPTRIRRYCVLTSPHVNKDAREHFELRIHKRIIEVLNAGKEDLDTLSKLSLAPGVDVCVSL
jgi:small subunit ribosomal protein S10